MIYDFEKELVKNKNTPFDPKNAIELKKGPVSEDTYQQMVSTNTVQPKAEAVKYTQAKTTQPTPTENAIKSKNKQAKSKNISKPLDDWRSMLKIPNLFQFEPKKQNLYEVFGIDEPENSDTSIDSINGNLGMRGYGSKMKEAEGEEVAPETINAFNSLKRNSAYYAEKNSEQKRVDAITDVVGNFTKAHQGTPEYKMKMVATEHEPDFYNDYVKRSGGTVLLQNAASTIQDKVNNDTGFIPYETIDQIDNKIMNKEMEIRAKESDQKGINTLLELPYEDYVNIKNGVSGKNKYYQSLDENGKKAVDTYFQYKTAEDYIATSTGSEIDKTEKLAKLLGLNYNEYGYDDLLDLYWKKMENLKSDAALSFPTGNAKAKLEKDQLVTEQKKIKQYNVASEYLKLNEEDKTRVDNYIQSKIEQGKINNEYAKKHNVDPMKIAAMYASDSQESKRLKKELDGKVSKSFLNYIETLNTNNKANLNDLTVAKYTKKDPLGMAIVSTATAPLKGLGLVEAISAPIQKREIDPNSTWYFANNLSSSVHSAENSQIDEAVKNPFLNKVAHFNYNRLTTVADIGTTSLLGGEIGGAAAYIAGDTADAISNAKLQGKSNTQALLTGGGKAVVDGVLFAGGKAALKGFQAGLIKYADDASYVGQDGLIRRKLPKIDDTDINTGGGQVKIPEKAKALEIHGEPGYNGGESNLSPKMPNMNYINPQTAIDYPPLRARTLEKVELANPSNNPLPITNQQEMLRGKLPGYDKAVINANQEQIPQLLKPLESPKMSGLNAGDLLRKELTPTPLAKMDEVGYNGGGSAEGAGKTLKPQNLMNELSQSEAKYTPDDVVMVTKTPEGKLMWLENGNASSGLRHIIDGHSSHFISRGVDDIPGFLTRVLQETSVKAGVTKAGPYAEYLIDGNKYKVAYGTNGYIVSFYPID